MKKVIAIFGLLMIAACEHHPLTAFSRPSQPPSTQTMSTTSTQTATVTPTNTNTSTSTATSPASATSVVTAITTMTVTATSVAILDVSFTTAFHSAQSFDVQPGQKGVTFGTFLFSNKSAGKVTVKDVQVGFIDSSNPNSGNTWADSEAAGHAKLISDHITNCVLRSWPETVVFAGPSNPNNIARADMHDGFEIQPDNGMNALALDMVCDMTDNTVDSDTGFAVEIMDAEDVQAYDQNGNRAKVTRETVNGSPPKIAAILVAKKGCRAGTTVDIGKGIDPRIAGSDSGFGIVWKDKALTSAEMDHAFFARTDMGGNILSPAMDYLSTEDVVGLNIGIAAATNGYVLSADRPGLGQSSTFMMVGFDGVTSALANNQPVTEPIVGSNNQGFTFLDHGEGYPALHKVQIGTKTLVDEKVFQWGAQAAFKTTNGAQTGGTWAFGMSQDGQAMIVVVNDGVYPNVISMPDGPMNGIVLDAIVATDVGYALAWGYTTANQTYRHYLSLVPVKGVPNGIVTNTVDTTSFGNSSDRVDRLAWNGKNIGLLAANPVVGDTELIMFRNDGTLAGDVTSIFTFDGTRKNFIAADLAASGSDFGIVSTTSSGDKAQFTPVNCN